MTQFESHKADIEKTGATLAYVAAEKRSGFFKPAEFLARNPISFPFLLDEDRQVTKAYGVYHRIGVDAFNIAHPASFVIAPDSTVRWIHVGRTQFDRAPVDQLLQAAHAL